MTLRDRFQALGDELKRLVIGRPEFVERLITAVLADGHILLEGPPGLAKTRSANLLANAFDATFQRVQFTPDLLPSDLTGTTIYDPQAHRFDFYPGPLFHEFILVDEINRAPAKVQAALLEAMEERQITVAGETHRLNEPFFVIATQNPIEEEGTYELPAAQLDRFVMRTVVDFPDSAAEREILDLVQNEKRLGFHHMPAHSGSTKITKDELVTARHAVLETHLADPVKDYIVRLVSATRNTDSSVSASRHIRHPVSPRGTLALARLAQARAWLLGRDYVIPEDVQALAVDVLAHRVGLTYKAEAGNISVQRVVAELVDSVIVV